MGRREGRRGGDESNETKKQDRDGKEIRGKGKEVIIREVRGREKENREQQKGMKVKIKRKE